MKIFSELEKEMIATDNNDSYWEELLERIEDGNIIPVIGQGIYWVKGEPGREVLLYDLLAERLAKAVDYTLPPGVHHKFAKAAFQFLREKKAPYFLKTTNELRKLLLDTLKTVKLPSNNPFFKLARIKSFNLFINTTYDDLLVNMLRIVRSHPCRFLNYTLKDKKLSKLNDRLFHELKNSKSTLVYNIYGNLRVSIDPTFTEKDILETIVSFHKDIEDNPNKPLSYMLKNSSLLFIGLEYKNWLYRSFIRAISNQPFKVLSSMHGDIQTNFVSDVFEPDDELPQYLKCYNSKVFYSTKGKGKEFVDTLFDKLKDRFPDEIIPDSEFPETAFISFPWGNRSVALKLAEQLRKDGIKVWVDFNDLKPGGKIDATITNAIAKCPVFIPLISKEAKDSYLNGEERYYYQEWQRALLLHETEGNPPKVIIPVAIDDVDWMYEKFKDFYRIKIPDGAGGDYERLKNWLLDLQISPRD